LQQWKGKAMIQRTADGAMTLEGLPQAIAEEVAPVIHRYFDRFNSEDYRAVADLFAANGVLIAPFEEPLVGQQAIYNYLTAEAAGMRATPLTATGQQQGETLEIVVKGKVKALLFSVNVQWIFVMGADSRLVSAEIRLLATLQELLQINRG
jgi:ketosteroid isomerase-like protein